MYMNVSIGTGCITPLKRQGLALHNPKMQRKPIARLLVLLSLCLCVSVVLSEMLVIIIPAVTESNHKDIEAQGSDVFES
jgi:hypothetical protein